MEVHNLFLSVSEIAVSDIFTATLTEQQTDRRDAAV